MKVVTRTAEYTIYRKRNQRYAVRNKDKQWVRGDDKAAILLAHNLVAAPAAKAAPAAPEAPAGDAGESAAGAGESSGDAAESAAGEADSEEAPAGGET